MTTDITDNIQEAVKKIKERALIDLSYFIEPGRGENEEFIEYKIRRKLSTNFIRSRAKGQLFHSSKIDMTKIISAMRKANMDLSKIPIIKGSTYINKDKKKFDKESKRLRYEENRKGINN